MNQQFNRKAQEQGKSPDFAPDVPWKRLWAFGNINKGTVYDGKKVWWIYKKLVSEDALR